jgi:hypothetical protein
MIEHREWVRPAYAQGFDGQTIAIIGYSHYLQRDQIDTEDHTECVVQRAIAGDNIPFFDAIGSYFGVLNNADLYNRALFFNFLPNSIGTSDRRYALGTQEQIEHGQVRALRLFATYMPMKAFVFTRKGWSHFPPIREEQDGGASMPLAPEFPHFTWGTYDVGGHSVSVFGLRHPLYARGEQMQQAVRHILTL